jgi:hypothetical protein
LEDRKNFGESSYNSGDGTDQRVQSLMFMMMTMMMMMMMMMMWRYDGRDQHIFLLPRNDTVWFVPKIRRRQLPPSYALKIVAVSPSETFEIYQNTSNHIPGNRSLFPFSVNFITL